VSHTECTSLNILKVFSKKQTNKQTIKQTNKQSNKQTIKQTNNKQTIKQTYKQSNKQTNQLLNHTFIYAVSTAHKEDVFPVMFILFVLGIDQALR